MKNCIINHRIFKAVLIPLYLLATISFSYGQDSTATAQDTTEAPEAPAAPVKKPVKNTFESIWIIDNQTVMVPIKGTFEVDFMHRFGTIDGGYQNFFGLFGGINIRLGFNYVPIDKLLLGVSFTEYNLTWEGYAKYALIKQTQDGSIPVSATYFGDVSVDTKAKGDYPHFSDRLMFFNQLIIARKISDRFSVQVAPSLTHVNLVQGFYPGDTTADGKSVLKKEMHHDHFAIAFSGKIKLSNTLNLLLNYDQPITKHMTNNPNPNLSAALEVNTSAHTFQVTVGNYQYITPQRNNYYNHNDYTEGQWLIGFNMTRLWNF
ncbi:MAG TPA: DUF5777 family beta-barrel protein [Parafilimonas sp.]|nr:DUF5777 family beta-barrel protein [Parafilimonas sp.]